MFKIKPSISELIKSSIRSILKNKSRTILTSLGIIIGVTSVILLTSIGNGLKNYVNQQFESLGSNLIYVVPGKVFNDNGSFGGPDGRFVSVTFTEKNISELKRGIKNVIIFPSTQTLADVKSNYDLKKSISIIGVTPEYGKNMNMEPSNGNGRFFTKEENDKNSNIAVLGYQIALDLFPNQNPLGKKIIVKGKNIKVIGVIDKKGGGMGGPSLDSHVFIPIKTSFSINGNQNISSIYIKAENKEDIDSIKAEAKKIMKKHFKNDEDNFSVFDQNQLLSSINTIIGTLTIALSGIAAISLVVGGIGIMNIMLVTVTERTKEIGLRKAIGAYPQAILIQFLFEAVILSGIGGTVGIILGWAGTLLINKFFPASITIDSILLAFGVSSLVGIIFGVAPAQKASKLSPIEALRYE